MKEKKKKLEEEKKEQELKELQDLKLKIKKLKPEKVCIAEGEEEIEYLPIEEDPDPEKIL